MKKILSGFFIFQQRGQKGIVLLSVLLFVALITKWYIHFGTYSSIEGRILAPDVSLALDSMLTRLDLKNNASPPANTNSAWLKGFRFDPNTAEDSVWRHLGLSLKQIQSLRKYFNHGGHIKVPEDVFKIKSIKNVHWQKIIPMIYIKAPNNNNNKVAISLASNKAYQTKLQSKPISLELNTCTKWNLMCLGIIDSSQAVSLYRFKKALGGFYQLNQLYEVKNFDTATVKNLTSILTLDTNAITKININNCSVTDLSKHPYVSYREATAIVNYRNFHGPYRSAEDLKKCYAANASWIFKMRPYLCFSTPISDLKKNP